METEAQTSRDEATARAHEEPPELGEAGRTLPRSLRGTMALLAL